jgi:hypothetical protein
LYTFEEESLVGSQWTKKSHSLFVLSVAKKHEECEDRMREIKTLFRPHLQTDAACALSAYLSAFHFLFPGHQNGKGY